MLRRGQESNLPRLLRTDNGFEDREDHQAPFTLREDEKENAQLSTSGIQRPIAEEEKDDRLFNFFKRADDGVEVGPIAGVEFGMEQFAIGANFKSAAARRNERERFDAFAEFKNFGRQTDGLRRVVSNDAIFDRDFGLHPASSFPMKMVRKSRERVKVEPHWHFSRSRRLARSASRACAAYRLRVEAGASPPACSAATGPPPPK